MVDAVTQALAAQPTFVPEGWTEENLQKFDDSLRAKGWNEEQIENYKQVGTQVPGNMPVGYSLGILPTVDEGVFGDPKAFIDAEMAQLMPAHPGSVRPYLGVLQGGPQTTTQMGPWGGMSGNRGNIIYPDTPGGSAFTSRMINPAISAPSDFDLYRNWTDMLVASGRVNAEDLGYVSDVDTGVIPGHAMGSDTFGLQGGLKAALGKQLGYLPAQNPALWGAAQTVQENIKSASGRGGTPEMLESQISNAERALRAYKDAQESLPVLDESVEAQIDRDAAAGLFDVGERSMASNVTWKPGTALSGKELNQWLKQGNVLTSSTARADGSIPKPGDVDFRGFTKDDVPSRTQQTLNTVMKAAPFVRSVIGKTPIPAALSALTYSSPVGEGSDIVPDYNVQDQMAQWYERAFIDPDEYGWARPTIEQRQEAIRGVQDAPKGFWGALQNRIADLIPAAEASIPGMWSLRESNENPLGSHRLLHLV